MRTVPLTIAALALWAATAFAEPQFVLRYVGDVPRVEISGEYPQTHYTVWRRSATSAAEEAVGTAGILCTGSCFADDRGAVPGQTYYYRFELTLGDGSTVNFGPYAATISSALGRPLGVNVFPNPGHGSTQVQLYVAATTGAQTVEAAIYDAGGRRVRTLWHGALPRGLTTFRWDGHDEHGAELRAGAYFLRLDADGRSSVTRVLRVR
jgi:hypothetical protein